MVLFIYLYIFKCLSIVFFLLTTEDKQELGDNQERLWNLCKQIEQMVGLDVGMLWCRSRSISVDSAVMLN